MLQYLRTAIYLIAAAAIWFSEDVIFSIAFHFNGGQTALVTVYFAALFGGAIWFIVRTYQHASASTGRTDLPIGRIVAMAPMLVVLVGSFAALPVVMAALVLGRVL